MKKKILLLVVVLLIVLPVTAQKSLPFTETMEIKKYENQYNKTMTMPFYYRNDSTYEIKHRTIQINIQPKEYLKRNENGKIYEDKDHFYKVFVSIILKDGKEETTEEFQSYLNMELEDCDTDTRKGRLFWDHAGESDADRTGEKFGEDDPLIVEDDLFTVTLRPIGVNPSLDHCDTDKSQYFNCKSDVDCILFIDSLTLQITVEYKCENCYTKGLKFKEEGGKMFSEAVDIEDAQKAIDKYKDARSEFEKAQEKFEEIGVKEARECQKGIDKCDDEIESLENVITMRKRLIYIFVGMAVIGGAAITVKQIGKQTYKPPKEGIELTVKNTKTDEEVTIDVARFDKIGRVSQLAGTKLGIVPFELVYNGKVCSPTKTVQECGLENGCMVEIVPLETGQRGRMKQLGILKKRYNEGTVSRDIFEEIKSHLEGKKGPRLSFRDQVFNIKKDSVTIGRSDKADIKIPDPNRLVSREHATIFRDEKGQYWVEDNDSANGTFVIKDGKYMNIEKWQLYDGDVIVLCHDPKGGEEFKLTFRTTEEKEKEKKKKVKKKTVKAQAEVIIGNHKYPITRKKVTIGRGKKVDIKISDPQKLVSREHATIFRDEKGQYWVEDNDSANGTFVIKDGKYMKIEKWQLYDGDVIVLAYDASRSIQISLRFKIF